jgi:hypothetical protein
MELIMFGISICINDWMSIDLAVGDAHR